MSKWSSRTSDQFIWLVSEKKTEAVNAYLIKNSKGEGGVRGGGGEKRKKNDQWQSLKNLSLSLSVWGTENWNSSSKTLFYRDKLVLAKLLMSK